MCEYKAVKKTLEAVAALPARVHDGRLHGSFNALGARTGRFSSSKPNLQNWHKTDGDPRPRRLICAAPGKRLVGVDLESVEMRIMAAFAGPGALLETLIAGEDIHRLTAERVGLEDRGEGKTLNYAINYGAGVAKIAGMLGIRRAEAEAVLSSYYRTYPEIGRLKRRLSDQIRDRGYVETPLGRRHELDLQRSYLALNTLVQGTAADLFKTAVVELYEAGVEMVLLVHDEIVAEVDATAAEQIGATIAAALTRSIPEIAAVIPLVAEAHVGECWADLK